MILDFIKHFGAYTPGDRAGFGDDDASRLIALGVAQPAFHAKSSEEDKGDNGEVLEQGEQPKRRGRKQKNDAD